VKDKYGSDYEPSESEEDFSSEDSDAEFITPEVDVAILKTLARIKKEDPKLYQSEGNVFEGAFQVISSQFSSCRS
jgi:protein KRI1